MRVQEFLQDKSRRVESALADRLAAWNAAPPGLIEAMRYSLFAGGKRLRPALALGACELACGNDEPALPAACAVEMIHTYSLIHDDLPAMDNDDMRRGRPTAHRQFDEATAILAGDALLTMAFHELARAGNAEAIRELAAAAGAEGMVGGQYADMAAEGKSLNIEALMDLHARKTGALITVSLRLGALAGGASPELTGTLTRYGHHLGLLFQITDDILDVTGDATLLGKSVGKDQSSAKATYPAVAGIEEARRMARSAADAACRELDLLGPEAEIFRELARHIVQRDR